MLIINGDLHDWEVVVGLEVHAQIISHSKLFSGAATQFCMSPNVQVELFDVAMPGTLPLLNAFCIEQIVKTGLALSCKINKRSIFDRKNYFYPDLASGYQITQFYHPIAEHGQIVLEGGKNVRIARIHLEQDAGKSMHEGGKAYIDFNRAGIALMEIVSEPDLRSSDEATEYLKQLRMILRFIETCDGDMEKGSLRCDVNVSVRKVGVSELGVRSEIKNLNSIRYVAQAIEYEANRQVRVLEQGGRIEQSTMLFDVSCGETRVIRDKEDAHDYRYFPEPDLFPVEISDDFINKIKASLPELPSDKRHRYMRDFGLSGYDAEIVSSDKDVAKYFEKVVQCHAPALAVSWITGELFGMLNKVGMDIRSSPVSAEKLIELLDLLTDGTISGRLAKQVFGVMFETCASPADIVRNQGLQQINSEEVLSPIVDGVLERNADKVQEYKGGKERLMGYFVGQVMQETKGKANPELVNLLIKRKVT